MSATNAPLHDAPTALITPVALTAAISPAPSEMTAAEAATRIKRSVVVQEPTVKGPDGKWIYRSVVTQQAVTVDEVLRFKDYGTHVVVVTTDGQKFSSLE